MRGDRKNSPIPLIFIILAAIVIVLLVAPVWASGDCKGQSCNDSGDVVVDAGSSIFTSDSSRAYGIGGSDYDIGRGSCRYHVGGATFTWTKDDAFCEGISLIDRGYEQAGINHVCMQSEMGNNYVTVQDCKDDMVRVEPITVVEVPDDDDEDNDDEQAHQAYAKDLAELESRMVARMESARKPQIVRERTVVEQKPLLTEEQATALRFEK